MNGNQIVFSQTNSRKIFWIIAGITAVLMPLLSFDYGISEDDALHNAHGKIILDYFTSQDSPASLSPLTNNCKLLPPGSSRSMNIFGGCFDLLSTVLHRFIFSFMGEFELRNMIKSLFGFLLFLFTGLLAKEMGGWKAGVIALLFIVLTPLLFGHSMYNPKDIPFAAFYMFSLFNIVKLVKALPDITLKRSAFLVVNISLLINVRVLGLVMLGYLFLAVFAWWVMQNYQDRFKNIDFKKTGVLAIKVLAVGLAAYLASCMFWPYAQTNPLKVPLYVFFGIKDFSPVIFRQVFEGKYISNFEIPWYYIPKGLIITMPLHVLLGMLLIIPLYLKKFTRNSSLNLFLVSFVLFVSLFPVLFAIANGSKAYDNGRHFLFTLPPLIAVCALSWNNLFDLIRKKTVKYGLYIMLAALLFQPFRWMVANHPLESLYFQSFDWRSEWGFP